MDWVVAGARLKKPTKKKKLKDERQDYGTFCEGEEQ